MPSNENYYTLFQFVYLHLTMAYCNEQVEVQCHAQFDCKDLVNAYVRQVTYYCCHQGESIYYDLSGLYLHLILAHSNGRQGHSHCDCECLVIGDRDGNVLPSNRKYYMQFRLLNLHFTFGPCCRSTIKVIFWLKISCTWWQISFKAKYNALHFAFCYRRVCVCRLCGPQENGLR